MRVFEKIVSFVTNINRWVSFCTLSLMMVAVAYFCLSRFFGYPVIGDVELVQTGMVMLIAGSLAYTEKQNAHISIGVIIDSAPVLVQKIVDAVGYTLVALFCFAVSWVFIFKMNFIYTSTLMHIPQYPFKILIVIGFFSWGIEALLKLLKLFLNWNDRKPLTNGEGG